MEHKFIKYQRREDLAKSEMIQKAASDDQPQPKKKKKKNLFLSENIQDLDDTDVAEERQEKLNMHQGVKLMPNLSPRI